MAAVRTDDGKKSRAWCFTINNYTEEHVNVLREFPCKYLVCGREVGANGTPHLQGYIYFKHPKTFNNMKNIMPGNAHLEKARGSTDQNREYCTKENNYFETGAKPMSQSEKGEVEQERWKKAFNLCQAGKVDLVDADIKFRYYRTCKDISRDFMTKAADLKELENKWIWGPPGVGKSRYARENFGRGAFFKPGNKWWDGYQGEENIIIDDFELDWKCLGHYLKIWADRYSFIAEYKGGSMHIRPKRVIVTSNYSIEEVFAADQVMVAAINRRFFTYQVTVPLVFPTPPPSPVVGLTVDEELEANTAVIADVSSIEGDDTSFELDMSVFDDL